MAYDLGPHQNGRCHALMLPEATRKEVAVDSEKSYTATAIHYRKSQSAETGAVHGLPGT